MKPKNLISIIFFLLMASFAQAEFMDQIDEFFENHQWLILAFALFYMISLIAYIFKCCNPFGPFCANSYTSGRHNEKDYHLDFIELDTI